MPLFVVPLVINLYPMLSDFPGLDFPRWIFFSRFLRIVDIAWGPTHFLVDICANQHCPPVYPIKLLSVNEAHRPASATQLVNRSLIALQLGQ